jgi:hypothetical protein
MEKLVGVKEERNPNDTNGGSVYTSLSIVRNAQTAIRDRNAYNGPIGSTVQRSRKDHRVIPRP